MLREFLKKIFSPPQPIEDKRIESGDFDRLKRHIKPHDDAADQACDIEHGPLSTHHWQHTPLTRSVSIHASQSAYEHYLQRNAARADNWAEFDETLHPTLANHDIDGKAASFLTPEEEAELMMHKKPPAPEKPLDTYLKAAPTSAPHVPVTPFLVYAVERVVMKNSMNSQLTNTKHWSFSSGYPSKKPKWLNKELAYKYCKGWLKQKALSEDTSQDSLRELARSPLPNVRAAVASNERIPYDSLWALAHDTDGQVRLRLAKNPNCTIELLEKLAADQNENVSKEAREFLKAITG